MEEALFLLRFAEFLDKFLLLLAVISLILALLQCFLGYRLLRVFMTLIGFLFGFALISVIVQQLAPDAQFWVRILAAVAGGVLFGFLAFKLYLLGVFLLCGVLAAVAVAAIPFGESGGLEVLKVILIVVAFIVAGVLGVRFQRVVIILITATSGAITAIQSLTRIVPELEAGSQAAVLSTVGLAVLGILVQFMTTKHLDKRRRK